MPDFNANAISPCSEKANCPRRHEDREVCSVDCQPLKQFQDYIDSCTFTGIGGIDYEVERVITRSKKYSIEDSQYIDPEYADGLPSDYLPEDEGEAWEGIDG